MGRSALEPRSAEALHASCCSTKGGELARDGRVEASARCARVVTLAAPPDETGTDWTGYPRRKPNPIKHLIVWLWRSFTLLAIVWVGIALYLSFRWWMVPFLLVFAFAFFVLFRNRRRAHR